MGVSVYSFVSAVVFFNIGLLVISVLRHNTNFLVRNSTYVLMFLFFMTIVRIVFPADLIGATVIQSKQFLPFLEKMLVIVVYGSISVGEAVQVVWITGSIFIIAVELFNFWKIMKEFKSYKVVHSSQLTRVLKNEMSNIPLTVTVSPDIDIPQVTGLFRAHIFIPLLNVSDSELSLILLHEIEHIKGRDIYIKLFYIVIKAIFWWNPLVHTFQHEVENVLELRCDMAVTRNMDYEERISYLDAILKVMKQVNILKTKPSFYNSNLIKYQMQGITKQRFEVILNQTRTGSRFTNIKGIFFILILFVCSYFIIVQPIYLPVVNDLEGHIEINKKNAYIVMYSDKTIELFVNGEMYSILAEEELRDIPYNNLNLIRKKEKK